MARPRKHTIDYFPHQCNHGKTLFILEEKYGNDGYSFWFKLLELLGSTEDHVLDCRKGEAFMFLQAKTKLSKDLCIEILNMLSTLDAIDADLWSEKVIWCQKFVDGITGVYGNRGVETPTKPSSYEKKFPQSRVSTDEKPQSKVKYSKVKYSKVKQTTTKTQIDDPKKAAEFISSIGNLPKTPIEKGDVDNDRDGEFWETSEDERLLMIVSYQVRFNEPLDNGQSYMLINEPPDTKKLNAQKHWCNYYQCSWFKLVKCAMDRMVEITKTKKIDNVFGFLHNGIFGKKPDGEPYLIVVEK